MVKFILNYSGDARDVENILSKKTFKNNYCTAFKISNGTICFSELAGLSIEEIKNKGFEFEERKGFHNKDINIGDIGILNESGRLYKIKITGILKADGEEKNNFNIDENVAFLNKDVQKYIQEVCGVPFRYVVFDVLQYTNDSKKGIIVGRQPTLSCIRKKEIILKFENLNWIDV